MLRYFWQGILLSQARRTLFKNWYSERNEQENRVGGLGGALSPPAGVLGGGAPYENS